MASLTPTALIPGVITTNGINSLRGTYLQSGATVAEIADLSTMRARIFAPEFEVSEIHPGQTVRVLVENRIRPLSGGVETVLPAATALPAGLESATEYKGLADTRYYVVETLLPNDGELRDQMSGTAKIHIGWQSIAGVIGRNVQEFIGRKFW